MAVVYPLSRGYWVEFDVLYVDNKWRMSHDWHSLSVVSDDLEEFVKVLVDNPKLYRGCLLVDIKWDKTKNRNDRVDDAIKKLRSILESLQQHPIWIQSSDNHILSYFSGWTRGYLCSDPHTHIPQTYDFITIDLLMFSPDDVDQLTKRWKYIIGFTCIDKSALSYYTHKFPMINGLVYDTLSI
jgi:hypothetical protein